MTISRLISLLTIVATATVAWMILGAATNHRTQTYSTKLSSEVRQGWGPGLHQPHLELLADTSGGYTETLSPLKSAVEVDLRYHPVKRGLIWHRTYTSTFSAQYLLHNPSSFARNIRIRLHLPSADTSYDHVKFQLGKEDTTIAPLDGRIETVTFLSPGETLPLTVGYQARGLNSWAYTFPADSRVKDFTLRLRTDFDEVDYPAYASSPTKREPRAHENGWDIEWNYTDTIAARDIAMDMPSQLHAGPVITRIALFAPLSLTMFFGIVIVISILRQVPLHPMTCAFMAAGFFSFQLLLAYLADIMPLTVAFLLSAIVSMFLVCGYVHLVAGKVLSLPALATQFAYMVLFSYTFFFPGKTGLTLTLMGIITLALLMFVTAKVNWEQLFQKVQGPYKEPNPTPAPLPQPQ